MNEDDRIELLAALVQRKWRALREGNPVDLAPLREEWAAASLLLELAQDNQTQSEQSYFVATRLTSLLYQFVRSNGEANVNAVRDALIEICKPTAEE